MRNWLVRWGPALAAALAVSAIAGCAGAYYDAGVQPQVSCAARRLDMARQLFEASRQNLARHFRERSASSLANAYNFAGDAALAARSTRTCFDYDSSVRYQALTLIQTSQQLRALAYVSMRDENTQAAITLLGEQYQDIFARRDIE